MKVKNIVFSGFAAAVLMGVAADASAAPEIVTKAYVDTLDLTEVGAAGSYIQKVSQADGTVSAVATPFDQEVIPGSTNAPTSQAVVDYVTDTTNLSGLELATVGEDGYYIKTVAQADGQVSAEKTQFDTAINAQSTDNNAPTSLAVYTAIQGANDDLDLPEVGAAGSYIQKVSQADGTVSAEKIEFDTAISAQSTDNNAPTSLAVYTAIQGANDDLDLPEVGEDGYYIKTVAQADGTVSAEKTQFDTAINAQSTDNNAPTSLAVYNAIQAVADTVPDSTECPAGRLCVWTSRGWVDATTPYGDEQ